jgi:hypothetical protein
VPEADHRVMDQLGHTSAALALEVYAKKMERNRETGRRMDELVRGSGWAQTGTNRPTPADALSAPETKEAA